MARAGGDGTAALERAGAETVKRAVELDLASRFQESLVCYQEGIDLLLQVVKDGKYHKQIRIEENATGFSYEKLFREYLTEIVSEGSGRNQQMSALEEIKRSLSDHGITLNVAFSSSIHDREIRFNNGWLIKIGRGLDYFKRPQGRFSIGYCDFDLRPCRETTVDVFHTKHTKKM
ncbi:hypothetical protein ASZ78_007688 [Callipepla squamata]|uniref:MIT domain-containing protein n=1 Tax=Callipepla squamata TaxID=9009 RepID=A0A226MUH0_CALSU|nr:hypothetical protein ASZ78_007688 [Callipepla squamata]